MVKVGYKMYDDYTYTYLNIPYINKKSRFQKTRPVGIYISYLQNFNSVCQFNRGMSRVSSFDRDRTKMAI